jgi:L-alanine-DL-glutamate epimerase-like enolase superfamily enzyme
MLDPIPQESTQMISVSFDLAKTHASPSEAASRLQRREAEMARIERVDIRLVDIPPKVKRTDAIQSFVSQETPIVTVTDSDGATGTGYSNTIGTGGSSVMRLLGDHLVPRLIGKDAERIEAIWRELEFATHATTIGAISSLALAAIDTALWDLRCKRRDLPLWIVAGGAADSRPLYTTEGGWLHIDERALIEDALAAREKGFMGSKIKIGRPHVSEDYRRLAGVRTALGPAYEIMTDANQGFTLDEAIRRAGRLVELDLAWIEEPLPADDLDGHVRLARATTTPIAVGESMYSIRHFREYMARGACSIIQVDVARIGGITPWLKVAHIAEAFDVPVCPHFLMELHVSLACAVPNGRNVEYIPQLDELTTSSLRIENGMAVAPMTSGIGVEWDLDAVQAKSLPEFTRTFR